MDSAAQLFDQNIYRLLARNLPDMAVFLFDHDLYLRVVEGTTLEAQGLEQERVEGRTIREVLLPEYAEQIEPYCHAALAGSTGVFEINYLQHIYEVKVVPIKNESGEVIAGMAISRDISDSKRAEGALLESQRRYQALFEQTNDAVFIISFEGKHLDVNQEAAIMLGCEVEEIIGKPFIDFIDPAEHSRGLNMLESLKGGARFPVYERTMRKKDGTKVPTEINVCLVRDEFGMPMYVQSVVRDITERKMAEQALLKSEERFRLIAQATNDALYDWDTASNIVWRNEGYQKILGTTQSIGNELDWWVNNIHPDDRDAILLSERAALNSDQQIWTGEYRLRGGEDDQYIHVIDRGYIVRNSSGKAVRMIGALTNITERLQAEKHALQLSIEREKMRFLTDFITAVSHDFRTPLSIINTSIHLLTRSDEADYQGRHLNKLQEQSGHIEKLVDGILTIARLDSPDTFNFQPVNLNDLVVYIYTRKLAVCNEKSLSLSLNLTRTMPPVMADRDWIYQCLLNMVENAILYTPEGGAITIQTSLQAEKAVIEILDTGIGISGEHLTRIFDPLYRVQQHRPLGGQGLGLTIARKVVDQHHGCIKVESLPGKGSVFRIFLPIETIETGR